MTQETSMSIPDHNVVDIRNIHLNIPAPFGSNFTWPIEPVDPFHVEPRVGKVYAYHLAMYGAVIGCAAFTRYAETG